MIIQSVKCIITTNGLVKAGSKIEVDELAFSTMEKTIPIINDNVLNSMAYHYG